jgi:hypothetical protein
VSQFDPWVSSGVFKFPAELIRNFRLEGFESIAVILHAFGPHAIFAGGAAELCIMLGEGKGDVILSVGESDFDLLEEVKWDGDGSHSLGLPLFSTCVIIRRKQRSTRPEKERLVSFAMILLFHATLGSSVMLIRTWFEFGFFPLIG